FKNNEGRDFSSTYHNLRQIIAQSTPDDYVLCVNRSAIGPLTDGWYRAFVAQYQAFSNIGLCGNTINFSGHEDCPSQGSTTHVQTYAYLSQLKHFMSLMPCFPGLNVTSRLSAIADGELRLSRQLLANDLGLTCLAWPQHRFDQQQLRDSQLPTGNISRLVTGLPYRTSGSGFWKYYRYLYLRWWSRRQLYQRSRGLIKKWVNRK
ncbi:MAG: hypothetical protein AAF629_24420, partial [Chloroflexota bacterium]